MRVSRSRGRRATAAAVAVVAALAVLLLTPGPAGTAPAGPPRGPFVPGEVLVRFRTGVDRYARSDAVARQGGTQMRTLRVSAGLVARVRLRPGQSVADAVAAYGSDPAVEYAEPNYVYRALATPATDPGYGQLWGLKNVNQTISGGTYTINNPPGSSGADIDAELAWDYRTDCSGVTVAVVDTGVNYTHQDLAANMWDLVPATYPNHGWDFVGANDADPMDENGHGTHVAATIGAEANNGLGSTGVCWQARILAVRVLDALGFGSTSDIIEGINFAVARGARVINLSLGGPENSTFLRDAVNAASNAGVVIVAAAGNDGTNNELSPVYPCNYTAANLVCVAALDQAFARPSFSNYGRTSVDVGAPGTNVRSAWLGAEVSPEDTFAFWSTTSTTSGGGWAYQFFSPSFHAIANPPTFDTGTYNASTDDRTWKSFTFPADAAAFLIFESQYDIGAGDAVQVGQIVGSADPFAGGGTIRQTITGSSGGFLNPFQYDVSTCLGTTCSFGFRLTSDATTGQGIGITSFAIYTRNASTYRIASGTSMATPHVSGIAALVLSYNPAYTAADAVAAIRQGGIAVTSLANVTTTGRAANAMGSLAYIAAPTGVTATVLP